jgi:hypothetical protein
MSQIVITVDTTGAITKQMEGFQGTTCLEDVGSLILDTAIGDDVELEMRSDLEVTTTEQSLTESE